MRFTKEEANVWSKLWMRAARGKQDAISVAIRDWQKQYEELLQKKANILKEFSQKIEL